MTGAAHSRLVPVLAAGLLAGGVLAGCGGGSAVEEAAATGAGTGSAAVPASATEPAGDPVADPAVDLAAGLLPAEAFGPGARVLPLTPDLLAGRGLPIGGPPAGLSITPRACADVLAALPAADGGVPDGGVPDGGVPDGGVPDVAAQAALDGASVTVQVLVAGPLAADALTSVERAAAACSGAAVDAPGHGTATVTVAPLELPDLGEDALGLAVTATATGADGRRLAVSGLAALVQDGDRLLALATGGPLGGAVDQAAFGDLLVRAYETQAAALD